MARALEAGWRARGRGGDAVLAALCAFVLLVAQTLTVAHASSHEAMAPGHDTKTCVYHVNGDRPAAALAPEAPCVAAPAFSDSADFARVDAGQAGPRAAAVWARGPPLKD